MNAFKGTLWKAADKLRGSLSASQYKDVVLGLVFLQYAAAGQWKSLVDNATSPHIGELVDEAMGAMMTADSALAGTLPQLYHVMDQRRLGELVKLLGDMETGGQPGEGARDLMGEVYEYFLGNFARAEGRRGGEFFTPPSVVRLIVEVLEPTRGRVYDPCCGSGGMFVQTDKFRRRHAGDTVATRHVAIYGQESVDETWRIARINLAIHGIDNTGIVRGDTLVADLHDGVQMDYVMANPPFNIKDWARDVQDSRWRYGVPPATNANFGWLQHILSKLAPGGQAGVVMTNGSMSSTAGGEGLIRSRIVEADLVSCMIALPSQLFRSTGIPVCLWFFAKDKGHRRGQVLFIDARRFGHLLDRAERALTDEEISRIGDTYHAWRVENCGYEDVPGFCKSVAQDDIRAAGHVLTPGRYVQPPVLDGDAEPLADKIARLATEVLAALGESAQLDNVVREEVERIRWR